MERPSEPKLCFILGILQRSGTNHIYRLLREHPHCAGPEIIREDFFVQHSNILNEYAHILYKTWNPKWEVDKKIGPPETLVRYFGDAIHRFLTLQLTTASVPQLAFEPGLTEGDEPKILLSKTPSVEGLEHFFVLFPEAYLIVIVRDGRAVVESGARSFDWKYEDAMQKWNAGARAILDLKEKYAKSNKKLLIVRYEDLVTDEKGELLKIFDFLGLAPELFDFDAAQSLGITGSSEIRQQTGTVHWQTVEKPKDFNPLTRFSNWDRKKHERFNWIAGRSMSRLGYELDAMSYNKPLAIMRNVFFDLKWIVKTIGFKIAREVVRSARRIR
ncbi:MAG: sulfotransferase [Chloroflexales bacterium]|nr:sulfotransferase [Chloroflexales bacterium]